MKANYDMIEQFLDGTLSPEAQREFQQLMQNDSDLQREIQAEQTIRQTLASDANMLPHVATEPSGAIMAKLGATSVGHSVAVSSGVLAAIFGTRVGISILSIVGVCGLVLGIFLFGPMLSKPELGETMQQRAEGATPTHTYTGKSSSAPITTDPDGTTERLPNDGPDQSVKSGDGFATSSATATTSVGGKQEDGNAQRQVAEEVDLTVDTTTVREQVRKTNTLLDYMRQKERQEQEIPKTVKPDSLRLNIEVDR